ncbi:probable glutathione S-transferase [Macadamia integrifolia]|uniref:probable glutathione S-transferase n=1 Tax=Macadamia integrifolia TaxID=60698 RepID=UPI001C5013F9|nr:probable glutathione S-transferase [Macadamia integrifolia]
MADEIVLLNFWPSCFGARVRIALAEKGINYQYREQNLLQEKSPQLLQLNPINKKVPVFIHNGRPICESLFIVEYIEEIWKDKAPLLPCDPYQRAQARFWADYIEKKCYGFIRRILYSGKEEERKEAKKEFIEMLKVMEGELGDKAYFGGDNFGFVDVSFVPFHSWFYALETFGNFSIGAECPKLLDWAKRCMQRESVAQSLPDPLKMYHYALQMKKRFGVE